MPNFFDKNPERERTGTVTQYTNVVDEVEFPRLPKAIQLHWKAFERDFWSSDKVITDDIDMIG